MSAGETDSSGCHDWSSGVLNLVVGLLEMSLDVPQPWLNVGPWTSILWLLLSPCNIGVLELLKLRNDLLEWEWAEALDSDDGDIISLE